MSDVSKWGPGGWNRHRREVLQVLWAEMMGNVVGAGDSFRLAQMKRLPVPRTLKRMEQPDAEQATSCPDL